MRIARADELVPPERIALPPASTARRISGPTSLTGGASFSFNHQHTFTTQGCNHVIYVWEDRDGLISESNELNNLFGLPVCVGVECEVDAYETANSCTAAGWLSEDVTQARSFCHPADKQLADVDWVKFTAFTGGGDSQNFRLAPLRNARMVTASESRKGERLREDLVKQVTGRDAIQAAHKYGQPFTFTPQFKLWFMSNDMPRGDVDDDAFWYRVRLFTLTKSHMGNEDNGMKDALTQRGNREGVLAWLVHGAMRYYDKGLGTLAQIVQNAANARSEQDHVLQWLTERCIAHESAETDTTTLYGSYSDWCADAGITVAKLSKMGLTQKLVQCGSNEQTEG